MRLQFSFSLLFFLFVFASCGDSGTRDNSVNSVLVVPVELVVVLDDTLGTATLTWTSDQANAAFSAYWILRNQAGQEHVDTLAVIPHASVITFVDSTLNQKHSYLYRVSVVNTAGVENASDAHVIRPLSFPGIQIERLDFDSRTASATLTWSAYRGARFRSYKIFRGQTGVGLLEVGEFFNRDETIFNDTGLSGDMEYMYEVVVVTNDGVEAAHSESVSGRFHAFVEAWPLPMDNADHVRLYAEEFGTITALVSNASEVRLLIFNDNGAMLEEQILVSNYASLAPRAIATALSSDNRRILSVGHPSTTPRYAWEAALLQFDREGVPLDHMSELWLDNSLMLTDDYASEIALTWDGTNGGSAVFEDVVVSSEGQNIFSENFDNFLDGSWDYIHEHAIIGDGRLVLSYNEPFPLDINTISRDTVTITLKSVLRPVLQKADPSWSDIKLEADVVIDGGYGSPGIAIGSSSSSIYHVKLHNNAVGISRIDGPFPRSLRNDRGLAWSYSITYPVLPEVRHGLSLELVSGRLSASITGPVWWSQDPSYSREFESIPRFERNEQVYSYGSVAAISDGIVFVAGKQSYQITPTLDTQRLPPGFAAASSEMRVWNVDPDETVVGVCLPELRSVFFDQIAVSSSQQISWPFMDGLGPDTSIGSDGLVRLGSGFAEEAGALSVPLSFDAGFDDRVFVLDAGSATIEVFDLLGNHITAWGRRGNADGEFDFGNGLTDLDLAGSVAVDQQGYIYVADPGNKRIQKFAP